MNSNADNLTDDDFISSFEACTLSPACFHHREHIRIAWLYVGRYGPIKGLEKVCEGIKRFAISLGKPDRYHETMTWAYVLLVRERIARAGEDQTWEEFDEANSDLFDWKQSILKTYYDDATLASDLARRVFLLPDRDRIGINLGGGKR